MIQTLKSCCKHQGHIEVKLQVDSGKKNKRRFIKISDSLGNCEQYEVYMDETSGIGTLDIYEVEGIQVTLVEVDEDGQQVCNEERDPLFYVVDQVLQQEDSASFVFDETEQKTVSVWICHGEKEDYVFENKKKPLERGSQLTIAIQMQDEEGYHRPSLYQSYQVQIISNELDQILTLDASNQYSQRIDHLESGCYSIRSLQQEPLFYQVNGRADQMQGVIELKQEQTGEVVLVFEEDIPTFQTILRIQKEQLTKEGTLKKPKEEKDYLVYVEGCGRKQSFVLNKENSYCVDVADLQEGDYRVWEAKSEHYESYYKVNGGSCKTEATIHIVKDVFHSVTIVNKIKNEGRITIECCVRMLDGTLKKPNTSDFYDVCLSSSFYQREFVLDHEHQFQTTIEHLAYGSYEVKEYHQEDYQVHYKLDDQSIQRTARFMIDDEQDHHLFIIHEVMKKSSGMLKIHNFMMDEQQQLFQPSDDFVSKIVLQGPDGSKEYCLNKENNWSLFFDSLSQGEYLIEQKPLRDMSTTYYVNQKEALKAYIYLGCYHQEVCIVNQQKQCGTLVLYKQIQDSDGQWHDPFGCAKYEVCVKGEQNEWTVCLNRENHWQTTLQDLPSGFYTITQKPEECLSYLVDDQMVQEGMITLETGIMRVGLITTLETCGALALQGLSIQNNHYVLPDPNASFCVSIENEQEDYEITLDNRHAFYACLSSLPQGIYHVKGKGNCSYDFLVDGQCFSKEATIGICKEQACVCVIRHQEQLHLHIDSVLMDKDGNDCSFQAGDAFTVVLSNDKQEYCYQLDEGNHWCIDVVLPKDVYTLSQSFHKDYTVEMYVIDGECAKENPRLQGQDCAITIISKKQVNQNMVRIQCREKQENSIEVCLVSDEESYPITLSKDNGFTYCLQHVKNGVYQVQERDQENHYSYCIDGVKGKQTSMRMQNDYHEILVEDNKDKGCIEICKWRRNEEGCYCSLDACECEQVTISNDCWCKQITLNQKNHFCASIKDLEEGWYQIEANPMSSYIVNNAEPTKTACVYVNNNANTVVIIDEQQAKGSITIHKRLLKEKTCCIPTEKEYTVMLSGNGYKETIVLSNENGYSATIDGLEDGMYLVEEQNETNVYYIINHCQHVKKAWIHVHHNHTDVTVVNIERKSCGSITLQKYIRMDGQLKRAEQGTFVFHLSNGDYSQYVILHEENNWSYTISDLEDGEYAITEDTNQYDTSYLVDDQSECMFPIVKVDHDEHIVKVINTEKVKTAAITIEKYIRTSGGYQKPDDGSSYQVQISGNGMQKVYELNPKNHYQVIMKDVPQGLYQVQELPFDETVRYVINGQAEQRKGDVVVCCDDISILVINEEKKTGGSIHIQKYIRLENGELVLPPDDFVAYVQVSKPGYQELYTLNKEQGFSVTIDALDKGTYVMDEVGSSMNVSYIINQTSEVSYGVVDVDENENEVWMINTKKEQTGTLRIMKKIYNAKGQEVKPQAYQRFSVELISDGFERRIILDRNNDWQIVFEKLPYGEYQVKETGVTGYEVAYCVNGICGLQEAKVTIQEQTNEVIIQNTEKEDVLSLTVTKYIRQGDGTLLRPAEGDEFLIEIFNEQIQKRISLNGGNAFTKTIDDLKEGIYTLREINQDQYDVSYRIHQEEVQTDATIILKPNQPVFCDVINERKGDGNTMEIFKYLLDEMGNYVPPTQEDVYAFDLIYETGVDRYELTRDNQWHVTLKKYPSGRYQIKEVDPNQKVQYFVNSNQLSDDAFFEATAGKTNIIGIINLMEQSDTGTLTITKRIKNVTSGWILPNQGTFVAEITGNGYNERIVLNQENQYTKTIANLPVQTYQVEEKTEGYKVLYEVDQRLQTGVAKVDVTKDSKHQVIILNEQENDKNNCENFVIMLK